MEAWSAAFSGTASIEHCTVGKTFKTLQDTSGGIELPVALRLGIAETEVLKTLGPPTVSHGDRLIYVHEHQESIGGEPYTSENIVAILLRDGMVWAIEASKTTTS